MENEMSKTFFIIIICITAYFNNVKAQHNYKNYLTGSFGGSDFHIKDQHASPLIFSSLGIAPSLQYIRKGNVSQHYIEVSYYNDYLGTSVNNFHTENQRIRIRYSYFHSISDFKLISRDLRLFLGGSLGTFVCHSDYYHFIKPLNSNSRSNESWYWSNSLDISALLEYNPAIRESFSIMVFFPLVNSVTRPKFSPSGDLNYTDGDRKLIPPWPWKNGETEFLTDNFSLNTIITYHRPLLWQFNFQITYEFYYSFYDKPDEVNMYMNNLRAGITFCF